MKITTLPTTPIAGVYQLTFPDGTRYVGASKRLFARLAEHAGPNPKSPMNRNGFNPDDVEAEVLCYCREEDLAKLEFVFIRLLNPEHNWRNPVTNGMLEDKEVEFAARQQEVERKGAFWAKMSEADRAAWKQAGVDRNYQALRDIAAKYRAPKKQRGWPKGKSRKPATTNSHKIKKVVNTPT